MKYRPGVWNPTDYASQYRTLLPGDVTVSWALYLPSTLDTRHGLLNTLAWWSSYKPLCNKPFTIINPFEGKTATEDKHNPEKGRQATESKAPVYLYLLVRQKRWKWFTSGLLPPLLRRINESLKFFPLHSYSCRNWRLFRTWERWRKKSILIITYPRSPFVYSF